MSVDRDDRVACPGKGIPDHRHAARAGELAEEPAREGFATAVNEGEAWRHIDVVHRVDRAAADRIVRVVLQQHPPELAELVARATAGERVERLAALDKKPLTGNVLLFDPDTSRVHAAQDRTVPPARDLAAHHVLERRHRGRVLLQACDPGIDVREDLAHGADGLRQARICVDVIIADHQEKRVTIRVRGEPVEDASRLRGDAAAQGCWGLVRRTDQR